MEKTYVWFPDEFDRGYLDGLATDERIHLVYGKPSDIEYAEIEIAAVRSKTRIDENLVGRMRKLKLVISPTHGFDHIDMECLKERGIEHQGIPIQSYDVAQGVMAYIFAYATNLIPAYEGMKKGEWRKKELRGTRTKGKTLGIIGYGRIGKEVARMASSLGMNIVAYDPYVKNNEFAVTLNTLLETSDFITIHVPLTEETKHMIGKNEISKMKYRAYLINTSRGGVVDEEALLEGLDTGKLAGAALDVFEHQLPFKNPITSKIIGNEKVIATPHSIGQTQEAVDEKHKGAIKIIKDYINRKSNGI